VAEPLLALWRAHGSFLRWEYACDLNHGLIAWRHPDYPARPYFEPMAWASDQSGIHERRSAAPRRAVRAPRLGFWSASWCGSAARKGCIGLQNCTRNDLKFVLAHRWKNLPFKELTTCVGVAYQNDHNCAEGSKKRFHMRGPPVWLVVLGFTVT
jgi:hypothetical protein